MPDGRSLPDAGQHSPYRDRLPTGIGVGGQESGGGSLVRRKWPGIVGSVRLTGRTGFQGAAVLGLVVRRSGFSAKIARTRMEDGRNMNGRGA
jgi:hypothetical protein